VSVAVPRSDPATSHSAKPGSTRWSTGVTVTARPLPAGWFHAQALSSRTGTSVPRGSEKVRPECSSVTTAGAAACSSPGKEVRSRGSDSGGSLGTGDSPVVGAVGSGAVVCPIA
jgi:hypothetical protein